MPEFVPTFTLGPDVVLEAPAFVDPTARQFGRVRAGVGCGFWPYSVIRAENAEVRIGAYCNIQDGVIIHVGGGKGTTIGDFVSIAHRAVVHGATIGNNCLVGIAAVVMDGAKVGNNCIIGAACLVPPGMEVPDNSVVTGVPGKVTATRDNFAQARRNALIYHFNATYYAQGRHDAWRTEEFKRYSDDIRARLANGEDVRPQGNRP